MSNESVNHGLLNGEVLAHLGRIKLSSDVLMRL